MPKLLKQLLLAELALGVLLALILLYADTGDWRVVAPIAALFPVALCIAFWKRAPLADVALLTYCAVVGVVGVAFALLQVVTIQSIILSPTNILFLVESILAVVLFFVLQSSSTRHWYVR